MFWVLVASTPLPDAQLCGMQCRSQHLAPLQRSHWRRRRATGDQLLQTVSVRGLEWSLKWTYVFLEHAGRVHVVEATCAMQLAVRIMDIGWRQDVLHGEERVKHN